MIDKWVVENMNSDAAKTTYGPKLKTEWQERFLTKTKWKLGNVDQGCALAGELFHLVQLSRLACKKYVKEVSVLQQQIADVKEETGTLKEELTRSEKGAGDNADLRAMIKGEIAQVVPEIIAGIQSKLVLSQSDQPPIHTAPPPEQIKHKLILEDQSGNEITEDQWTTVVKSKMRKKLQNIPVSSSYLANKGVATVTFPTAASRDEAAERLKSDYNVTTKSESPKKLSPKIKLLDVSQDNFDDSDEDIIENIKSTNQTISDLISDGEVFKIIFKKKEDGIIVIETTAKIRQAILHQMKNRIFLGLQYLYVRDHIHLSQCYHCQCFGHYADSDFCKFKDKKNTCFYCASDDHKSKDCKNKKVTSKHRCVNCIREGRALTHHKATDPLCPTVIAETLRMYSRTDGMDVQSKNVYLKSLERLRQKRRLY